MKKVFGLLAAAALATTVGSAMADETGHAAAQKAPPAQKQATATNRHEVRDGSSISTRRMET